MVPPKHEESADSAEKLLSMSKRRGFYWPSFEIYGGIAGFYDYGPLGTLLRNNITDVWRSMFKAEGFYEIDTPTVNPEIVFRSSGHLEFFSDYLVECMNCRESFRADHIVDLEGQPSTPELLAEKLRSGKARCPRCGSSTFSEPRPFNLMFRTQIGPAGTKAAYLRPETAQGIFMDFQQLSRFFREKLPFGAIQTGRGYRNEISPRQGLLRLRELNMLEAELFIDPSVKHWKNFDKIVNEELTLLPRKRKQLRVTVGKAVEEGIIGSEVLAYFMFLTHRLITSVGVDQARSRFRQHEADEMAHYSRETWDFEAELVSGWTELGGVAYRGDYDLSAHVRGSSADLTSFRKSSVERVEKKVAVKANRARLGPVYKKLASDVASLLESLDPSEVRGRSSVKLSLDGKAIDVSSEFYTVAETDIRVRGDKFVPHVVEPSLGLDRIFFSVLEHNFSVKNDSSLLMLPANVAPLKAGVFPLISDGAMSELARGICKDLLTSHLEPYYDESGSIGRRYARMDEVGTPYCITVDDVTIRDGTVTVRDRDSRKQVRIPRASLTDAVRRLLSGVELGSFGPLVTAVEETEEEREDE